MTRTTHISASSVACFKACPRRYFYKYVEGIRPIEDTEALRMGTNWHRLLEILSMKSGSVCPDCGPLEQANPDCSLCAGGTFLPKDMMDAVVRELDRAYANRPLSVEPVNWATERVILLYSLVGWQWYYSEDRIQTIEREVKFKLPLRNPASGRALPRVKRVGKIDRIVRQDNQYKIGEYKSTSKSLDSDSSFWDLLNLSTQISMYALAAREMNLGFEVSETLYDAWHKPGIRPKKLTQADTKKFVDTGLYPFNPDYYQQEFEVTLCPVPNTSGSERSVTVDDTDAETEAGKKEGTLAIRETSDMFGARLLADIQARPGYYFARKPIARTDADLRQFEIELYHIYRTIRQMAKDNAWFMNESQCEATFKCPYTSLCYHGIDVSDGHTPDGFERIYKEKR